MNKIQVYVANLPGRTARRNSIETEFEGRPEFNVSIVPAIKHPKGAWGLWQTFMGILKIEIQSGSPFFIFCEDDHVFTNDYDRNVFIQQIDQAQIMKADLLSGGFSWTQVPIQVTEHLFWVHRFTGTQFLVVFRQFYERILNSSSNQNYILDHRLSELSDNVFMTYPIISIQKEFGYSDATPYNNEQKGFVDFLFNREREKFYILNKVKEYYAKLR
mgnify:CR=1 FL=1